MSILVFLSTENIIHQQISVTRLDCILTNIAYITQLFNTAFVQVYQTQQTSAEGEQNVRGSFDK